MTVLNSDYSAGCINHKESLLAGHWATILTMSHREINRVGNNKATGKRPVKRPGRKPSRIDDGAKLERSRQSARECRARKKLRYQYLEELVLNREKAVFALRDELETYKHWCSQLENGGPVPDALMKMLANEDISIKKRQIEQVRRSLIQQQFQISSSSSASSTSPELPPSSRLDKSCQPLGDLPNHSYSQQQQQSHPQQRPQMITENQQVSRTTQPQRQIAVDHSHEHQPKQKNASPQSSGPTLAQSFLPHHPPANTLHQLLRQHQHEQPASNNTISQQSYSLSQREQISGLASTRKPQEPDMSIAKSVHSAKYVLSSEGFNVFPNIGTDNPVNSAGVRYLGADDITRRSLSNPVSMNPLSRPDVSTTTSQNLPSLLQDFITANCSTEPTGDAQSMGFGLFTGCLMDTNTHSSSWNIPTSVTIEDSSSSDEQPLLQSSIAAKERNLPAPFVGLNQKPRMITNTMSTTPVALNYDTQTKFLNQTNVTCHDVIMTSNTWSPSSTRPTESSGPSPTPSFSYGGLSSFTPPSSSTASPAPLSSLSSILELCASSPGASSITFGSAMDTTASSGFEDPNMSTFSIPMHHTSADPTTFNPAQIPDWYSFLADLQDGGSSTLTSRHLVQSTNSASTALTQLQHKQPLTPDQTFRNVPNIIDEILDSNDGLL